MRWSEAVTLQFVKIYLQHECLWNPEHPGYKLKHFREKAYANICFQFKASTQKSLTSVEVKLKIKNLRTTYLQQVHKILEKSNSDSIYEPSLIWFHEMDKCLKNVPSRYSGSYNTSQETPKVDSSSEVWMQQVPVGSSVETNPDPLVSQTEEYMDLEDSASKLKRERNSTPQKSKKKKKTKHRSPTREYITDSNSGIHVKEYRHKEDEFDIYGKYIASQLRKIDLHKALRLQLKIQSLVSEERLSDRSD